MKSNNLVRHIVASALVFSLLPTATFAETSVGAGVDANVSVRTGLKAQICVSVTNHFLSMESAFVEMRSRIDAKRDEQRTDLERERAERSARVGDREKEADQARMNATAKLDADAKTDAQKAALVKFQAEVQAAVSARRAAFQAADATFRQAVEDGIKARRTAVDAAVASFHASVQAVLNKAKQDCAAGVSFETIKANVRASIEAARSKFQQDRKAIDRVGEKVTAAVKVRQDAQAKAMTTFKAAMEKARVELKAAFSASASTSAGS